MGNRTWRQAVVSNDLVPGQGDVSARTAEGLIGQSKRSQESIEGFLPAIERTRIVILTKKDGSRNVDHLKTEPLASCSRSFGKTTGGSSSSLQNSANASEESTIRV